MCKKTMKYDSTSDTLKHIKRINELLIMTCTELLRRGTVHDNSKLVAPEKELFDELTYRLSGCTYGSEEYLGFLSELKPALDHHYGHNSHHPEHYKNGINDFDLFDLVEMFCDWKAASERHNDGNIHKSIEINAKRFEMSEQLTSIFSNTAKRLKY